MRAFIAIELPDELKKKVSEFQSDLKKSNILEGSWTKEYHLTLKFLGDISENKLEEIEKVLAVIASKTKCFELELKGASAFPSEDYVRVLWIGARNGDENARALQKEIDENLANIGFGKEKDYKNHITLCRVKSVSDKNKLKKSFEQRISFGMFKVSEIKLFKSTLTKSGAVHEVLKIFKLA